MRRGRRIAWLSSIAGLLALGAAAAAFKDPLLAEWYLYRLKAGSPREQRDAVERLVALRYRRAVPAIIARLREDGGVGPRGVAAVLEIDPQGGQALLHALQARDSRFRKAAVGEMLRFQVDGAGAAEVLVELALKDRNEEVSNAASEALPRVATRALPLLIEGLRDPRSVVLEDRDEFTSSKEIPVKGRAISGLEELGPAAAEAVPLLTEILDEEDLAGQTASALAAIGPAALPAILRAMEMDQKRIAAVRVLRSMAERCKGRSTWLRAALPAVIDAIHDPDYWTRESAVDVLGEMGAEAREAVPALLAALRDPEFYEHEVSVWSGRVGPDCAAREVVAAALEKIGPVTPDVVPALIEALSDQHPCLQEAAAKALGAMGSQVGAAVPALIRLLERKDPRPEDDRREGEPQVAAAKALGAIGSEARAALSALKRAAGEGQGSLGEAALDALEKIGGPKARSIEELIAALGDEADGNEPPRAAKAFEKLGREAVPLLLAAMSSGKPRLRRDAIYALGEIGPDAQEALPHLLKAFSDPDPEIRSAASYALFKMNAGTSVPLPQLIEALKDSSTRVREIAISALFELGTRASPAAAALAEVLRSDPESGLRIRAAYGLAATGRPADALPPLVAALADPSVRAAAAGALGKLGPAARDAAPRLLAVSKDAQGETLESIRKALKEIGATEEELPASLTTQVTPRARPPAQAEKRSNEDQFKALLSRFKTLGIPDLKDARYVKIATGQWSRRIKRPVEKSYEYGLLLRSEGENFTVLGHRGLKVYRKTDLEVKPEESVGFEVLDLAVEMERLIQNCEFPEISGRSLVLPLLRPCAFGNELEMGSCPSRAAELFTLALACEEQGLQRLALDLCRYAEAVGGRDDFGHRQNHTLGEVLEERLPDLLLASAVASFEDPGCDRRTILSRLEALARGFPDHRCGARATEMVLVLEKMVEEDDARAGQAEKPLQDFATVERATELIFRLRDQRRESSNHGLSAEIVQTPGPARELARIGPEALPALIPALRDERFTRIPKERSSWHDLPGVKTIGECAREVAKAIVGRDLTWKKDWTASDPEPTVAEFRAAYQAWFDDYRKKGEEAMLHQGMLAHNYESPEQAKRLLERNPEALPKVIKAARREDEAWLRASLIERVSEVAGDGPVPFLLEEVEQGPFLDSRLAAAQGLAARRRSEGVAAMLREWMAPRPAKPKKIEGSAAREAVLDFLLRKAPPADARRVLREAWEPARPRERVKLLMKIDTFTAPEAKDWPPSENLEPFLLSLLGDRTRCRFPGSWGFPPDEGPSFGPAMRICDFAAYLLSKTGGGRYPFGPSAAIEDRDRAIAVIMDGARR
jgi:HEAT repeat protein